MYDQLQSYSSEAQANNIELGTQKVSIDSDTNWLVSMET